MADVAGATQAVSWDAFDESSEETVEAGKELWGRLVPLNPKDPCVELTGTGITIGRRQSECDVIFTDRLISGKHCKIFREESDDIVFVQDLSSNGTFLNGEKLGTGKTQTLRNGAEITFALRRSDAEPGISYIFNLCGDKKEKADKSVEDKYDIRETLGTGNFASVKLAIEKSTGKRFAMKVIDKKKYMKNAASRKDALMDEVTILKAISHANVIGIQEVFDTEKTLYITLELVTGGELYDAVVESGGLPEAKVKSLCKQLLDAVNYLHKQGIVHRDLKPENILFATKAKETVKISDFGLSRAIGEGSALQTMCGTPQYLAPEVITNSENKGYSKLVDIWSLGGILYFMLAGAPPFDDSKPISLFDQIRAGVIDWSAAVWKGVSAEAKDLITCMLAVDPKDRYDAEACLRHPWLSGGDFLKLLEEREQEQEEKKRKMQEEQDKKEAELESKRKEEALRRKKEEDERIKAEVEKRTKELADKLKEEAEQAEKEKQKKRKREEMSSSQEDLPMCQYGIKCYRKNPQHFKEFRHPAGSGVLSSQ
eukprot:TRINITY_DN3508_c0_g1_i1.p1 TRINITY_DN3508_c0_g1~~TRINITY_DN3508_c0_g1_i1.p1  ORF type:complete len:541 (+),score=161.53 TRINITY_DN3508_c0_g1_i1:317-1939(+)